MFSNLDVFLLVHILTKDAELIDSKLTIRVVKTKARKITFQNESTQNK